MPKPDRSEWLEYEVSGKWRVRFYEEKNDFVISIEHCPDYYSVVRFDQSKHKSFHPILMEKSMKILE